MSIARLGDNFTNDEGHTLTFCHAVKTNGQCSHRIFLAEVQPDTEDPIFDNFVACSYSKHNYLKLTKDAQPNDQWSGVAAKWDALLALNDLDILVSRVVGKPPWEGGSSTLPTPESVYASSSAVSAPTASPSVDKPSLAKFDGDWENWSQLVALWEADCAKIGVEPLLSDLLFSHIRSYLHRPSSSIIVAVSVIKISEWDHPFKIVGPHSNRCLELGRCRFRPGARHHTHGPGLGVQTRDVSGVSVTTRRQHS